MKRFPKFSDIQRLLPKGPDPLQIVAAEVARALNERAVAAAAKDEWDGDDRFALAYAAGARVELVPTSDPFRMIWRTEPVSIWRDPVSKSITVRRPPLFRA